MFRASNSSAGHPLKDWVATQKRLATPNAVEHPPDRSVGCPDPLADHRVGGEQDARAEPEQDAEEVEIAEVSAGDLGCQQDPGERQPKGSENLRGRASPSSQGCVGHKERWRRVLEDDSDGDREMVYRQVVGGIDEGDRKPESHDMGDSRSAVRCSIPQSQADDPESSERDHRPRCGEFERLDPPGEQRGRYRRRDRPQRGCQGDGGEPCGGDLSSPGLSHRQKITGKVRAPVQVAG